jgi:hypothetical protein
MVTDHLIAGFGGRVMVRPQDGREGAGEMQGEGPTGLAQLAGDAIVAPAVTEGWETRKRKFARLLGHGDAAKTKLMEQHLAGTHEQLVEATGTGLESARETLVMQWATRFTDLLEEDPVIRPGLLALVQEIHMALPARAVPLADNGAVVPQDMNIDAGRGRFASKAVPKGVMPLGPTSPGLATS